MKPMHKNWFRELHMPVNPSSPFFYVKSKDNLLWLIYARISKIMKRLYCRTMQNKKFNFIQMELVRSRFEEFATITLYHIDSYGRTNVAIVDFIDNNCNISSHYEDFQYSLSDPNSLSKILSVIRKIIYESAKNE